jgi:uncharacterized protein YjbI with pentapeptide repeats
VVPLTFPTGDWWAIEDNQYIGKLDWHFEVITPDELRWGAQSGPFDAGCSKCDLSLLYHPGWSMGTPADLTGANLTSADLTGATLDGFKLIDANLTGAKLEHASMAGANLAGLDFTTVSSRSLRGARLDSAAVGGAKLQGVDLTGASLRNVDLRQAGIDANTVLAAAGLQGANLADCVLPSGIDLHQADFTGAELTDTSLAGALMYGAKFDQTGLITTVFGPHPAFYRPSVDPPSPANPRTSFIAAQLPAASLGLDWTLLDLSDATLVGLGGPKKDLSGLKARYVRMAGAELYPLGTFKLAGADFSNADLRVDLSNAHVADSSDPGTAVASFEGATLHDSNLSGAKLVGVNFKQVEGAGSSVKLGANFSQAYMPNAIFTDATLTRVNFAGAQLYGAGARVDNATLVEADFSNAILAELDLSEARLQGATFDYAVLTGAQFKGVDLRPSPNGKATSFVQANLIGANFKEAQLDGAQLANAVVALPQGVPFFTLGDLAKWAPDLDRNILSPALRDAFSTHRYTLHKTAIAYALNPASEWVIEQYPTYNLTLDPTPALLTIAVDGVKFFTMPSTAALVSALDAGKLPEPLRDEMTQKGYTLAASAEVAVDTAGSAWDISQVPSLSNAIGYTNLGLSAIDGELAVFGTQLMVSRLGPDNVLQLEIVDVKPTQLTETELGPNTVCPNGTEYAVQREHRTWMEMMTATAPPGPPACVPSGDRWCPMTSSSKGGMSRLEVDQSHPANPSLARGNEGSIPGNTCGWPPVQNAAYRASAVRMMTCPVCPGHAISSRTGTNSEAHSFDAVIYLHP